MAAEAGTQSTQAAGLIAHQMGGSEGDRKPPIWPLPTNESAHTWCTNADCRGNKNVTRKRQAGVPPGMLPRADPFQGVAAAAGGAVHDDPNPLPRSSPRRGRGIEGEAGIEAPLLTSRGVPRCYIRPLAGIPRTDRASRIRTWSDPARGCKRPITDIAREVRK